MELLVYPVIFFIWRSRRLTKSSAATMPEEVEAEPPRSGEQVTSIS
jgi:hypothetical protein